MICPACKSTKLKVVRTLHDSLAVYRRRACFDCAHRFYTEEKLFTGPGSVPEAIRINWSKNKLARKARYTEEQIRANRLRYKLGAFARETAKQTGRPIDEVRAELGLPPRHARPK